jgi:DNA-binding transcriptional MerR regulator
MEETTLKMYKIGTLSKFLGIPEHVLRFYERKGLLKSKRKPDSPMRYYDEFDINLLVITKRLRALGFTVDEIRGILQRESDREQVDYYNLLSRRQDELTQEINSLLHIQQEITKLKSTYRLNEKYQDRISVQSQQELVWFYMMDANRSQNSMRINETIIQTLMNKVNPSIYEMAVLDMDDPDFDPEHPVSYSWGFAFPPEYLSLLPADCHSSLLHIRGGSYYVSGARETTDCMLDPNRITGLYRHLTETGNTPSGYFLVELLPGGWTNYMIPIPEINPKKRY